MTGQQVLDPLRKLQHDLCTATVNHMSQQPEQRLRVDGQVTCWVSKNEHFWLGACAELRIIVEVEDREDLESHLHEVIESWLRRRLREGNLQEVLARLGWEWNVPPAEDPETAKYEVPLVLREPVSASDFNRYLHEQAA